jgi:hypothetical protein
MTPVINTAIYGGDTMASVLGFSPACFCFVKKPVAKADMIHHSFSAINGGVLPSCIQNNKPILRDKNPFTGRTFTVKHSACNSSSDLLVTAIYGGEYCEKHIAPGL